MFFQDKSDDDECSDAVDSADKNDDETYDGSDAASKAVAAKPKRVQAKRKQSPDCRDNVCPPSEPLKKKES